MMASVERFGTVRLSTPDQDERVAQSAASPCLRNAILASTALWLLLCCLALLVS